MTQQSLTLNDLASLTGSRLVGDASHTVSGATSLKEATSTDVSYLGKHPYGQKNPRYEAEMRASNAGAVIVHDEIALPEGRNFLVNTEPSSAFQIALEHFLGVSKHDHITGWKDIHNSAVIHKSVTIGERVTIGPLAVIEKGASIGDDTVVAAHSYVGANTVVGKECLLHPRTTIRERCRIGDRVILQPGVVIGGCGFGYSTDTAGNHNKLRQLGIVVIEDDVEIGANTAIDRARFGETRIGKGSKIDNLVQIGHGVTIGEHNIIVGQTGIAGSTTTGKYVVLAGQVAVNGHLHIADNVIVSAKSSVHKSITEAGTYGGTPVAPMSIYMRRITAHARLHEHVATLKQLQKRVTQLEAKGNTPIES